MWRRLRDGLAATTVITMAATTGIRAQEHLAVQSDLLFYGDNTEFRNPFREGETIFGATVRLALVGSISDRVDVALGVFTNQRFGSDSAFELVRPIVSMTVRGRRSAFVFGTFPPPRTPGRFGPERDGPHDLLAPLQRETLTFDRAYEAGLQWTFKADRLHHEMWIDWQRVNTPEHRERFDTGASGELTIRRRFALPFQLFIVHEGGQLFASGPVADSFAGATGLTFRATAHDTDITLDAYGVASRFVPNRSEPNRSRNGAGFMGRTAAARAGWRIHLLLWRGDDVITAEGDPNYLSITRAGARYRGVRDYAETGVMRTFMVASGASIAVSARLHRTEKHYEYSYRVLGVASFGWRLK